MSDNPNCFLGSYIYIYLYNILGVCLSGGGGGCPPFHPSVLSSVPFIQVPHPGRRRWWKRRRRKNSCSLAICQKLQTNFQKLKIVEKKRETREEFFLKQHNIPKNNNNNLIVKTVHYMRNNLGIMFCVRNKRRRVVVVGCCCGGVHWDKRQKG